MDSTFYDHSSPGQSRRDMARRLLALLDGDAPLNQRYAAAKQVVRAFRRPAFYEVTTRCNLRCEGCYYFEGGETSTINADLPVTEWRRFFEAESARGVSMAYFVGAEPALAQRRLLAAAGLFPWGNIGTNGTVKIHKDIPYRIGVSVWAGDDATDVELRGASVFRKALKNYAGDPRAIMLFTVSRWTMAQVPAVAAMCRDNGLPLTINLFSPTRTFLAKLMQGQTNDSQFFRVSHGDHSPILTDDDLRRVHDVLAEAIDRFPGTVIYSHSYNDQMCTPGPRHYLDPETGIATDCKSRVVEPMRYFTTDLKRAEVKCATPDVDCSQCRMYSSGWSSRFVPRDEDLADRAALLRWIDVIDVLGQIFLYTPAGTSVPTERAAAP